MANIFCKIFGHRPIQIRSPLYEAIQNLEQVVARHPRLQPSEPLPPKMWTVCRWCHLNLDKQANRGTSLHLRSLHLRERELSQPVETGQKSAKA
jgi:hypothetical protein